MKKIIIGSKNKVEIDINDLFFDYITSSLDPQFTEFLKINEDGMFIKDLLPSYMNKILSNILSLIIQNGIMFACQEQWQDFLTSEYQFHMYAAGMYNTYKEYIAENITLVNLLAKTCEMTNSLLGYSL